jgi:hypothetical protein
MKGSQGLYSEGKTGKKCTGVRVGPWVAEEGQDRSIIAAEDQGRTMHSGKRSR